MVQLQQPRPVRLAGGPLADFVQVGGAVGEGVGPPGEEKNVLDGAEREEFGVLNISARIVVPIVIVLWIVVSIGLFLIALGPRG